MKKTKKIIFLLSLAIMSASCAAPKVVNTVWMGADPVKYLDSKGLRVSSIYLMENDKAMLMQSIIADSALVVAPYKVADGKYQIVGNLKKNAEIHIDMTTAKSDSLNLKGLMNARKNSMILVYPDNTQKPFLRNTNLKFE